MTNQLILIAVLVAMGYLIFDQVSSKGQHRLETWVTKVFYSGSTGS